MNANVTRAIVLASAMLSALAAIPVRAAELQILLPLGRAAYQTNEWIDVSVVRSDSANLPAGQLTLTLTGSDGGAAKVVFPVGAAVVEAGEARRTEHLHLNGRLLRPGKYTLEVACDGAKASIPVEIYSHVRRSDFRIIDWASGARGKDQVALGQDGMGFNLLYAQGDADASIRGGLDYMACCTMGGAHQMDMRMECDWSDPYVLQGGAARVARRALEDRTHPNCAGVHFYDEPGLTWWKHAGTGQFTAYNIPSQDRSYRSAFGADAIQYNQVKPNDPQAVSQWTQMSLWRQHFMEAAWKYSAFDVSYVRPDYISATQTQYAWYDYGDGYYFNIDRPLPVISGHGGYSDRQGTYFLPSLFMEYGRLRAWGKPCWYLPEWFDMTSEQFRLEQYLSFMMGVQGMAKPPGMNAHKPPFAGNIEGIVESNKTMARLGTVFMTMKPTRPEVAVLYSMSQNIDAQIKEMQDPSTLNGSGSDGGGHTLVKTLQTYLALKQAHIPAMPIVEEDVLDGSLAQHHRALVIAGVNHLDAKVVAVLEAWIVAGGKVLLTDDCRVQIKDAIKLGAAVSTEGEKKLADARQRKDKAEMARYVSGASFLREAQPLAKALAGELQTIGVKPPLDSDNPEIFISRQAEGDVEYLFAVNATARENPAAKEPPIQATTSSLALPADARPVYDAVRGGVVAEFKEQGKQLAGNFRFGPGQMRVFARTARPIGAVQVLAPTVVADYVAAENPLRMEFAAVVVDDQGKPLAASIPLQIRLIDPLGALRYDIHRASSQGMFRMALPLAANDPSGEWKVVIRELLNNREGSSTFAHHPAAQCGALAGATQRAVCFGNDRENIFRFFRMHRSVTIVKGSSDYDGAAAQRLAESLKPWDVACIIVNAVDVAPRVISAEETPTWVGLDPGNVTPSDKNAPGKVGFGVKGPAIVLGTPEDNAVLKFIAERKFLPYAPKKGLFPGHGRGMIAWQRDAVSYQSESIALIAYDAAGMAEAVGSVYEAAAAMNPLTPWALPLASAITPASQSATPPEAAIAWQANVPDGVLAMDVAGGVLSVYTRDGFVTRLDGSGKMLSQESVPAPSAKQATKVPEAVAKALMPGRIVKRVATDGDVTALGYWGGTVQIFDGAGRTRACQVLPNDVGDLLWLDGKLVVGLADGRVVALRAK